MLNTTNHFISNYNIITNTNSALSFGTIVIEGDKTRV